MIKRLAGEKKTTNSRSVLCYLLLALCSLFIFSCPDPLSHNPGLNPDGTQTVRIVIGTPARTIMPDTVGTDNLHYVLTFTRGNDPAITKIIPKDENTTDVDLAHGTWTLVAKGYADAADSSNEANALSEYTDTITIPLANTAVNIKLTPNEPAWLQRGEGKLEYSVTLPSGSGTLDITGQPQIPLIPGLNSDTITLPSGVYELIINAENATGDIAYWKEQAYIFHEATTSTGTITLRYFDTDLEITDFGFTDVASKLDIDDTTNTITVLVPLGTDLTNLTPQISFNGIKIDPAPAATDFSVQQTYTIYTLNNDSRAYTVNVEFIDYTYTITGNATNGFTATGGTLNAGLSPDTIQNVINAIRADAEGEDCTIIFDGGAPATALNIGNAGITFANAGSETWGDIKLEGNVTGSSTDSQIGTIMVSNGDEINIEINANISATGINGNAIRYNGTGTLIVTGGTISHTSSNGRCIYNIGGSVTITGGTISSTGSLPIQSISIGLVTISEIDPINNPTVIEANGSNIIEISQGTGQVTTTENQRLLITGGTIKNLHANALTNTIRVSNQGIVSITGGRISANGGVAIRNERGIINISEKDSLTPTIITSSNADSGMGTIVIQATRTASAPGLIVSGGKIENTSTNANQNLPSAIHSLSSSPIELNGGIIDGAVRLTSTAAIKPQIHIGTSWTGTIGSRLDLRGGNAVIGEASTSASVIGFWHEQLVFMPTAVNTTLSNISSYLPANIQFMNNAITPVVQDISISGHIIEASGANMGRIVIPSGGGLFNFVIPDFDKWNPNVPVPSNATVSRSGTGGNQTTMTFTVPNPENYDWIRWVTYDQDENEVYLTGTTANTPTLTIDVGNGYDPTLYPYNHGAAPVVRSIWVEAKPLNGLISSQEIQFTIMN